MIISSKNAKTKWDSPTFTIRDISRDKLSLILVLA
jgi:tRNA uridine 5-carbamoylmethylation protein Kti12